MIGNIIFNIFTHFCNSIRSNTLDLNWQYSYWSELFIMFKTWPLESVKFVLISCKCYWGCSIFFWWLHQWYWNIALSLGAVILGPLLLYQQRIHVRTTEPFTRASCLVVNCKTQELQCQWWWWWWWWWIVFVVWLTNQRRLALFSAGTIVRDPQNPESLTRLEQYLNLHRTWLQALLNEVVLITTVVITTTPRDRKHLFNTKYIAELEKQEQITNSKQKMKEKTDQKTCTRNLHNKPGDIALSRQIKKNKNARLYYLVPYVKFWSMWQSIFLCYN